MGMLATSNAVTLILNGCGGKRLNDSWLLRLPRSSRDLPAIFQKIGYISDRPNAAPSKWISYTLDFPAVRFPIRCAFEGQLTE